MGQAAQSASKLPQHALNPLPFFEWDRSRQKRTYRNEARSDTYDQEVLPVPPAFYFNWTLKRLAMWTLVESVCTAAYNIAKGNDSPQARACINQINKLPAELKYKVAKTLLRNRGFQSDHSYVHSVLVSKALLLIMPTFAGVTKWDLALSYHGERPETLVSAEICAHLTTLKFGPYDLMFGHKTTNIPDLLLAADNLTSLDLSCFHNRDQADFARWSFNFVGRTFQRLKYLNVKGLQINNENLEEFARLNRSKLLSFSYGGLANTGDHPDTAAGFVAFAKVHGSTLESLNIVGASFADHRTVRRAFKHIPNLARFTFGNHAEPIPSVEPEFVDAERKKKVRVDLAIIEKIARHMPLLQELSFSLDDRTTHQLVTDAFQQLLTKLPKLTMFNTSWWGFIKESVLETMAEHCPLMARLRLMETALTDSMADLLAKPAFPHLIDLTLHCTGLTPKRAEKILAAVGEGLTALELSNPSEDGGATIAAITAHCTQLQVLNIRSLGPYTDKDLAPLLKALSGVRDVRIGESAVTFQSLRHLCHKPQLRTLDIVRTSIKFSDLVELVTTLPKLRHLAFQGRRRPIGQPLDPHLHLLDRLPTISRSVTIGY